MSCDLFSGGMQANHTPAFVTTHTLLQATYFRVLFACTCATTHHTCACAQAHLRPSFVNAHQLPVLKGFLHGNVHAWLQLILC